MSTRFSLSFSQIECRCGAGRIVGQVCPYCGATPSVTEVDPSKQLRQRAVSQVRSLDFEGAEPLLLELTAIPERLHRALDQLLTVSAQLAKGVDSGPQLEAAFRDVARLHSTIDSFRYRPSIGIAGRYLEAVIQIERSGVAVLDALCAETPIAAQRSGRVMQEAIDSATAAVKSAMALVVIRRELDSSDAALFSWVASAVSRLAPDQALSRGYLDFDGVGASILRERIDEECPMGLGLSVAFFEFLAQMSLDEGEFWQVVREQVVFLESRRAQVEALPAISQWKGQWDRMANSVWDLSNRARALLSVAKSDENYVWTGLAIAHDLEEGIAKELFATLQLAFGVPSSYREILAKGLTNLTEWAASKGLLAAKAFPPAIRNAHAHHDFEVDDGRVSLAVLKPPQDGPLVLSSEEFVDAVLKVFEATIAMWLGTTLVMTRVGEPPDLSSLAQGIPVEEAIGTLMSAGGWVDLEIRCADTVVSIKASANRDPLLAEFAGLVPSIPSQVVRIDARMTGPSGIFEFQVPLDSMRRYQRASDEWSTVALAILHRRIVVNGSAFLSREYVRKVIAIEAMTKGAQPAYKDAMHDLRELRTRCQELDDSELDAGIAQLQSIRRNGALGLATGEPDLGMLSVWAAASVTTTPEVTILSGGVLR